ncbi:DUF169 domain-containing protein [Thermodesulfobacteriota bacterium]
MDLAEINKALEFYVRPQTFPVAVRMCQPGEELPAKTKVPNKDLGSPIAVCQGISLARRYGWALAIGPEDQSCPHGLIVLGFVPGRSYLDGSSAEAVGIAKKEDFAPIAQNLKRLEYGQYGYVLTAPLHKTEFEPHFLILYGNPAQIARLVQGAVALDGIPINTPASGGIACSSVIARTMLTDECQIVLAGAGDRYFALTQDHELAFTIPMNKVETTIEGLKKGHQSGMHRYPTPSSLKLEGVLPPAYERMSELLREEQA